MSLLSLASVKQIPTTAPDIYAFTIVGHVSSDDAEAMAEFMNNAFDRHETVSMLLRLTDYTGSDGGAMFESEVIVSRWRSLTKVERYAVVGAPEFAQTMIAVMDKVIPVEANAFATDEEAAAWNFVGTTPA